MDSIIARQKVGKRRPVREAPSSDAVYRYRPDNGARPHIPAPRKLPRQARRGGARFPGIGGRLALVALKLRERLRERPPIRLGLRRGLRAVSRKTEGLARAKGLSGPRLAILGCASLTAILAVSAGIAAAIRGPAFPLPRQGLLPAEGSAQNLLLDYVSPELADGLADADQEASALPPAPVTLELSTYTVRPGDTLASIARRFGLFVDTIISANGITSAVAVKPGAQLRIPNIDGLIQKVRRGDSLASVAKRYKIDTTRIVDANDLGSSRLVTGMSLFIPGARLPDSAIKQALGQRVAWPLRGALSSFFGYRPDPFTGVRRFHAGIDIVANSGSPVRAAMDGKVSDVGYNANYGNYVILNHADGFQSLYGHLTAASVVVGSKVEQGSVIGISGNTGYSTGPHLHFGLFRRSLPLNPLKYLKM